MDLFSRIVRISLLLYQVIQCLLLQKAGCPAVDLFPQKGSDCSAYLVLPAVPIGIGNAKRSLQHLQYFSDRDAGRVPGKTVAAPGPLCTLEYAAPAELAKHLLQIIHGHSLPCGDRRQRDRLSADIDRQIPTWADALSI